VLPEATDSLIVDSLQNDNRLQLFTSFLNGGTTQSSAQNQTLDSSVADSSTADAVQEVELLTRLRPLVIQVRKRPQRSLGQSTVASKAIARQPGLAEADVIKAIQALPGVVASSDFSSKIYVRGGSADQNLFLFDDAVVYSPVHFFGLFSTFLVEGIDQVNFYKGGFSPAYGNRLGSVVDVKSRKGGKENNDSLKLAGSAQLTTFATTFSFEASKKQTRLNLAGRSTYIKQVLGLLNRTGVTDINIDYRFFDIQGNLF
jgi:outer membrane cobalamin receptor